jgi:hypothetical protein
MPATLTYPGVYIEEIPSGVHTVRASQRRSQLGKGFEVPPTIQSVTSFGDFGASLGVASDFTLGYAVRDFFANGGSRVIIVRLYKAVPNKASKAV